MSRDLKAIYDVERYRPLGLLGNPFTIGDSESKFVGADVELASEAHELLGTIMKAAAEEAPKPIAVMKPAEIPSLYHMRAMGATQRSLASDDGVNIMFGYVQLFMMRLGRVRSVIAMLAERLVFRDFDQTLAIYIQGILAEHDTSLVAYQLIGEDGLNEFAERFSADPLATTIELFGGETVERHPELAELADSREADLPSDVEDEDSLPEIDATVGDSPANAMLMSEEAEAAQVEDPDQFLVDYIVEHTKAHLSPVVARALRVYRERGQVAAVEEMKVTKAPKKTLAAIVKLALVRFKKVALIFDGFEGWYAVPADLKVQIAATLSEIRWLLDRDAVMVLMLEEDRVPELEEQFGHATRLKWAFSSLKKFEADEDLLDRDIVESWLARSAYPGCEPLTLGDSVLGQLFEAANGFRDFALKASTAVENAADRGVAALDDEALAEAMDATLVEAEQE